MVLATGWVRSAEGRQKETLQYLEGGVAVLIGVGGLVEGRTFAPRRSSGLFEAYEDDAAHARRAVRRSMRCAQRHGEASKHPSVRQTSPPSVDGWSCSDTEFMQ